MNENDSGSGVQADQNSSHIDSGIGVHAEPDDY